MPQLGAHDDSRHRPKPALPREASSSTALFTVLKHTRCRSATCWTRRIFVGQRLDVLVILWNTFSGHFLGSDRWSNLLRKRLRKHGLKNARFSPLRWVGLFSLRYEISALVKRMNVFPGSLNFDCITC